MTCLLSTVSRITSLWYIYCNTRLIYKLSPLHTLHTLGSTLNHVGVLHSESSSTDDENTAYYGRCDGRCGATTKSRSDTGADTLSSSSYTSTNTFSSGSYTFTNSLRTLCDSTADTLLRLLLFRLNLLLEFLNLTVLGNRLVHL